MVTSQRPKSTHLSYQPRDVINAPSIKEQLLRRSVQRGDDEEIQRWIGSHFFRYLIGNFQTEAEYLTPIHSLQDLVPLQGNGIATPEWVIQRLSSHSNSKDSLWWLVPDSPPLLLLENRILEFLKSRKGTSLEGKLQRINCPQALALWTLEHLAFEKQRTHNKYQHQPDAVITVLELPTGRFVELLPQSPALRAEMAFESQIMRHCLGQFASAQLTGGYGENYAAACESAKMRLFSFRNHHNQPHITISAAIMADGKLEIDEVKGKQNRPPITRYQHDVLAFLNLLSFNEQMSHDILKMGIVRIPDAMLEPETPVWRLTSSLTTENEQLWLLREHPHMFELLPNPQPIVLWYAAGLLTRSNAKPPALQQFLTTINQC